MGRQNLNSRFYLNDWYINTESNRLSKDETEVKLESKVMAVLFYLAQNKNELVTREDLERAIWGDTIVSYDSLTSCIAKLRKVLDDDARQPRYIETISKKGYRLIARVSTEERPFGSNHTSYKQNTGTHRPQKLLWSLALSAVVLTALVLLVILNQEDTNIINNSQTRSQDLPSIVILPFANLSNHPEKNYFSAGVTADITTALSRLSGLFVISGSSASGYKYNLLDHKQIAGSLGVRYILEGSIRLAGSRLRVNVHLIDAGSDIYLWSEKYDRELTDLFDVQDEITANIVNTLSVKLTAEEKRRTARQYTTSLEAYDDFLRGQAHYIRLTREGNQQARDYYQQAIDRDDAFARAYSAMALTYVIEHRNGWNTLPTEPLEKALQLARKGVALNDELPQAYWVLGYVNLFRQNYFNAVNATNRAIELDPNFADSYLTLAVCKIYSGSPEQALQLVRKAMLLNPQYPAAYASILGQSYLFMEQYDKAVPVLRDAIERNLNLINPHIYLIVALSKLDQLDEAIWAAGQLKTLKPDFSINNFSELLPIQDANALDDIKQHLQRAGL